MASHRYTSPFFPRLGFDDKPTDDRGEPIEVIRPNQLAKHVDRDTIRYSVLKTRIGLCQNCDRPPPSGQRINPQTIIALGAVLLFSAYILLIVIFDLAEDYAFLIFIAVVSTSIYLSERTRRAETKTIIANTLVAEDLCGRCLFPLEGLAAEDDGCLVCPECGSAWRHERVVRPYREIPPAGPTRKRDPRPDIRIAFRFRTGRKWTVDDCARCVHTPSSRIGGLSTQERSELTPELRAHLKKELRSIGAFKRLIFLLLMLGASAFLLINLDTGTIHSIGHSVLMISLMSTPAIIGVIIWFSDTWILPHRISAYLCGHGRCGSCATDLSGLVPQAHGMRVCERCKASWLDERFTAISGTTAAGS